MYSHASKRKHKKGNFLSFCGSQIKYCRIATVNSSSGNNSATWQFSNGSWHGITTIQHAMHMKIEDLSVRGGICRLWVKRVFLINYYRLITAYLLLRVNCDKIMLRSVLRFWLEVNKCSFTFSSEIRQIQCTRTEFWCIQWSRSAGPSAWTSIKFRQVHWIFLISRAKVSANLLT